jgi:hypothetical protein
MLRNTKENREGGGPVGTYTYKYKYTCNVSNITKLPNLVYKVYSINKKIQELNYPGNAQSLLVQTRASHISHLTSHPPRRLLPFVF